MPFTTTNNLILWLRAIALVLFIVLAALLIVSLLRDSKGRLLGIAPAPCPALGLPVDKIDEPVPLQPKPGEKGYTKPESNHV
jgi:hypothetical protein